ncbi:uncharacterized protein LOC116304652 [Actinia tenebrosa]|uniref:Uncharacterized protein LOC116304652 n=1 Tax=Actinia tenebrosa TaxID=6105 RepID=A0A6P8ITJ7_ACTTE|nr:uncharacterized protein LOC116304652 [Actinia tenebrosa]
MGWQKRGKGHNSSTGQGAVMSLSSGKILDFTTRTKTCRHCTYAKKNGSKAKKHDCRKNHFGSSKAMEPAAAVHLFTKALKSKVKFSVYTGDKDSTTAAHIKENGPYPVEKWTDTVHAKRSLTTKLMNLSQRGKFTNSSILSQKVINYLVKCFSYSVSQNKGNPDKLKNSLLSKVPHAFGKHHLCSELWCRAQNDDNYKHSDLPYGKDLYGEEIKTALARIFDEYCTDLVIQKLSPAANSQRNESLNSVIGSKNPKIRYYGGSESSDFRIACGISQANLGYQYISHTLQSLNIEPGKHISKEQLKEIETHIPKYTQRPISTKFSYNKNNICNFIIYDIETNTTGKRAEICQLSAIDQLGSNSFNTYILPSNDIDIYATRVNGLSVRVLNGQRILFKENEPVVSVSLEKAPADFVDFLQQAVRNIKTLGMNDITDNVYTIMIGHNSLFDAPTLLRQALRLGDGSMSKCNQASIYQTPFQETYDAHDALEDVKALRKIVFDSSVNFSNEILVGNVLSVEHVKNDTKYLDHRHELLQTFKGKLYHEKEKDYPVTKSMCEKIAMAGLSYQDLKMCSQGLMEIPWLEFYLFRHRLQQAKLLESPKLLVSCPEL